MEWQLYFENTIIRIDHGPADHSIRCVCKRCGATIYDRSFDFLDSPRDIRDAGERDASATIAHFADCLGLVKEEVCMELSRIRWEAEFD